MLDPSKIWALATLCSRDLLRRRQKLDFCGPSESAQETARAASNELINRNGYENAELLEGVTY